MLQNRPITAIVPARGGSKGVPGKNMLRLGKHTLLERAVLLAQRSRSVDRVLVSTDDAKMYDAAAALGAAPPSMRPADLASDTATTVDVVRHLIADAEIEPGWLLLLQPTSPLRTCEDLANLLRHTEQNEARAIASVVRHEEPRPEKLLRVEGGVLCPYMDTSFEGPRQALPQPFALNGAFYLIDRDLLLETGSFLPPGVVAFEMPEGRSANIDTPTDWAILNAMVETGHWRFEEYD